MSLLSGNISKYELGIELGKAATIKICEHLTLYSIELRTRKYVAWYLSLSFARNLSNIYGKESLDTATKTGLDASKTASKKSNP